MDREIRATFDPFQVQEKSVLDLGAWNGAFSIEAKRRGAKRVVALDHYTWNHPIFKGRESFEAATRLCNVEIETIDKDLDAPQLSLDHLGEFDIVLFLGVFYHLVDPIAALREAAALAREALVVETHLAHLLDPRPAMVFFPSDELSRDETNWWGPNRAAVEKLLRHFGFDLVLFTRCSAFELNRGIFHAFRCKQADAPAIVERWKEARRRRRTPLFRRPD